MKKTSKKRLDFLPNIHNKYSIRKFTVGTASILLGTTLLFGASRDAEAVETDAQQAEEPAEHGSEQATPEKASVEKEAVQAQSVTLEVSGAQPTIETNQTTSKSDVVHPNQNEQVTPANKENVPNAKAVGTDSETEVASKTEIAQKNEVAPKVEKAPKAETVQKEDASTTEDKTSESSQVSNMPENTVDYTSLNDGAKAPIEFVEQYLHSSDKKGLVRNLLSETYNPQQVDGILSKLNVDYHTISAEDLFQDILRAGIEYTNEQTSKYTVYAVRPMSENGTFSASSEGDSNTPVAKVNEPNFDDPNTSSNINIPANSSVPEAIGALKTSASIDPDKGIVITGTGKTYQGQKPATYVFIAKPDRAQNKMNFEVKYYAAQVLVQRMI